MPDDPPEIRLAKVFIRQDGYAALPTRVSAPLRRMALDHWSRHLPELLSTLATAKIRVEDRSREDTIRWATLVHVIAILAGTDGAMAHSGACRTGAVIFEAGYSEARLSKLLSSRGTSHLDQCIRLARFLAVNGGVPIDLRPLAALILYAERNEDTAEGARLTIAQTYFAAADRAGAARDTSKEAS
jgi:hypothetical protein